MAEGLSQLWNILDFHWLTGCPAKCWDGETCWVVQGLVAKGIWGLGLLALEPKSPHKILKVQDEADSLILQPQRISQSVSSAYVNVEKASKWTKKMQLILVKERGALKDTGSSRLRTRRQVRWPCPLPWICNCMNSPVLNLDCSHFDFLYLLR